MRRRAGLLALLLTPALIGIAHAPASAGPVNAEHSTQVAEDPANFTPHVLDGSVRAIVQVGSTIFAGGNFTKVAEPSGLELSRAGLVAFDATDGTISRTIRPSFNGLVQSVVHDGSAVYVAGEFSTVDGVSARGVAKLDPATGKLQRFVQTNGLVRDLVVRSGRLYLVGNFTKVANQSRLGLAAVDLSTGGLDPEVTVPFTGVHNGGRTDLIGLDVSPDGSRLVAIGNFSAAGGQPRRQVAVLDVAARPAVVTGWSTEGYDDVCVERFSTYLRDVDIAPDGRYFVAVTTGAFNGGNSSGTLCDAAARFEIGPESGGQLPTWVNYTGGDTLWSVGITGPVVYIGGHQRWVNNPFQGDSAGPGAVPREGIAALDPVNGLPLSWNPGRARGVGAFALYATDEGLWVGSDTARIGGENRPRIAFLPLAGGRPVPEPGPARLPNMLYLAQSTSPGLTSRSFDGSFAGSKRQVNAPGLDWSRVRGAFLLDGTLYYGYDDNQFYARSFTEEQGSAVLSEARVVPLRDDPETGARIRWPLSSVTGMFYDPATHRLYYTVSGLGALHYRYFTRESEVVGAVTFTGQGGGIRWDRAAGVTLAASTVYYGTTIDGALRKVAFSNGGIVGSPKVVSNDGSWRQRAIFLPNS